MSRASVASSRGKIQLSTPDSEKLRGWLAGGSKSNDHEQEVEAVLQRRLTRAQFQACMRWLTAKADWKTSASEEETLDVSTADGLRVSIRGREAIARFWNTQAVAAADATIVRKRRADAPLELPEYDFRINCKTEQPVDDDGAALHLRALSSMHKHFRLKKRVTLRHVGCEGVRIDMTQVRAAPARVVRPSDSPLLSTAPQYEVEVEVEGRASEARESLLRAMEAVLRGLHEGFWPGAASVRDRVLAEYLQVVGKGGAQGLERARKFPRQHFVGPMPVTLERDALPLAREYCVTDKADGERYLAFASPSASAAGLVYFLNNRLELRETELKLPAGTLLDGELLADGRFAAFDIYLDAGKDVRSLPLMAKGDSRLKRLEAVCVDKEGRLRCKRFSGEGETPAAAARRILLESRAGQFPYRIDGLIFTHRGRAVGADAVGEPASAQWGGGRWKSTYKWKPAQDNSIDFLVRFPSADAGARDDPRVVMGVAPLEEGIHKVLHLHVGFHTQYDQPIDAMTYLTSNNKHTKQASSQGKYIARRFHPEDEGDEDTPYHEAYVPLPSAGPPRCANGDEILEGSVVEFAYGGEADAPFSPFHWKPLRVRYDKTEEAAASSPPRVTANDNATANSVWRSIRQPVTEAMVTDGTLPLPSKDVSNNRSVYYALDGESDMKGMRTFHNQHIKLRTLLLPLKEHGVKSLLDIGCGKGGDLHKWQQLGLRRVVGLDLFADNISNPVNGAYARLSQVTRRGSLEHDTKYAFVPYDVAQPIDAVHINRLDDASDRMVMQTLWSTIPRQMVKPKELSAYYGMAADKFDVVSCQFAVHYFFGDEATRQVFADNVATNLRPGGFFVGACMDGERVRAALRDVPKGGEISATAAGGRVAWSIRKEYDDDDDHTPQSITVYVDSIGTRNREYLVDASVLQALLEKRGLRVFASGSFEDAYEAYLAQEGKAVKLSDVERRFSFLNRYFVFRREQKTG